MPNSEDYESFDFWRSDHLRRRFGTTNMSLHRWEKKFHFPKPIVIAGRKYWKREEVLAYERQCSELQARKPGRSKAAG